MRRMKEKMQRPTLLILILDLDFSFLILIFYSRSWSFILDLDISFLILIFHSWSRSFIPYLSFLFMILIKWLLITFYTFMNLYHNSRLNHIILKSELNNCQLKNSGFVKMYGHIIWPARNRPVFTVSASAENWS